MSPEEALGVADEALIAHKGQGLTDLQRLILRESLAGKGYEKMQGYDAQHFKNEGAKLFKDLTEALGEKVSKTNFRGALERRFSEVSRSRSDVDFLSRIAKLKKLQRKARASCIERFRVAVASRETAITLAEDQSLGTPPDSLTLKHGSVHVLTGELGLGKTLIAQRLFQLTLAEAIDNSNAPIPIYIELGKLQKGDSLDSLEKIVEIESSDLGDFEVQGAFIILDGLDEVDSRLASQLLSDAYVLADTLPKTSVLITSRPILCVNELGNDAKVRSYHYLSGKHMN